MRFHLPVLPGRPATRANSSCAYSTKAFRFKQMMETRGHEVILYGGETEDVNCYAPGLDPLPFEPDLWISSNLRAAAAIAERREDGDVLLIAAGRCQQSLADAVPLRAVEYGVGYAGVLPGFRVFESAAWMHTVYAQGLSNVMDANGQFYDAVVPNFFEVDDFPLGTDRGENLLYVGRLIERKGVQVAVDVARRTGRTLYLAGEGDFRPGEGEEGIHYVGSVGPEERAELMGSARALLCPTIYVEPFGGVAVEAMLCGTPVISTDWGAFRETIQQGVTGYRCRRLGEFVWAAEHASELDSEVIRSYAISRYSTETVAPQYERFFEHIATLDGAGFYDDAPTEPAWGLPAPSSPQAQAHISAD